MRILLMEGQQYPAIPRPEHRHRQWQVVDRRKLVYYTACVCHGPRDWFVFSVLGFHNECFCVRVHILVGRCFYTHYWSAHAIDASLVLPQNYAHILSCNHRQMMWYVQGYTMGTGLTNQLITKTTVHSHEKQLRLYLQLKYLTKSAHVRTMFSV